jgi:plasmid stabilization system protein ParE
VSHFRVSLQAKQDLLKLAISIQKRWGKEHRSKYISGLKNKFCFLADNPSIIPERQEFSPNVRFHQYQSHLIIYLFDDVGMTILRVLQLSPDIDKHL